MTRPPAAFRQLYKHLLFGVDESRGVITRQLETVTVRDGVCGTGFDAISAEDAAIVVNVIDLGVALGAGDTVCGRVFRRFNVNAVCRTRRRTQETGNALLKSVLVALQNVRAPGRDEDAALTRALVGVASAAVAARVAS